MQSLLEVKTEVSLLTKEIKDLKETKINENRTNNSVSTTNILKTLLELQNGVAAHAKEIDELKRSDRKTVAFMAQLTKHMVNPRQHTVVVFDAVLTNVGGAYKPSSGVFLAPVNGTYTIHLVASSSPKSTSEYLHLYIMHNMLKVGYIFLDQIPDRALIRSTSIVIQLRAGDTVFVKIGNPNPKGTLLGSNFHTVFSGFLIN
ncbi:complement C1q-like protein 3 [Ruditapes philippinarum]|uniref:complement C1q-like protein 3 n=1 Tax=Ruditapes philippinarum TaxID=129788 RepID=UPI00295BB3DA|nr:complement C1q-like protein 3 [Ruditapes philippinarum]